VHAPLRDKFADRCAKVALIVSIRKAGRTRRSPRRAATGQRRVSLEAITGFANTLASDEAVRAAAEALERLNEREAAAAAASALDDRKPKRRTRSVARS